MLSWLVAALSAAACEPSPRTSSSSSWAVCDVRMDCDAYAEAVDCVRGYCVDGAGNPIERTSRKAPATGGSDGNGARDTGGAPTSGGAPSASGGSPTSGGSSAGGDLMALGGEPAGSGGAETAAGGANGTQVPCGSALDCDATELCVLATTVIGPTQTNEYLCAANPCPSGELDCGCAAIVCNLSDGRSRVCAVTIAGSPTDVELLCEDGAQ